MSFHRLPPPPSPRDDHDFFSRGGRKELSTSSSSAVSRGCKYRKDLYPPPTTPPLHWKLFFHSPGRNNGGMTTKAAAAASARKLAAGLWQLQLAGGTKVNRRLGIKPGFCPAPYYKNEGRGGRGVLLPHVSSDLRHGILHNKSSRKGATTKGDVTTLYNEVHCFYARVKINVDHQQHDELLPVSAPSTLQSELSRARSRIHELEFERQGFRKGVNCLLRELNEERRAWRAREEDKVRAVFDGLKSELGRERRGRRKMEVMNSRLVDELTSIRLSAERFGKVYEKEKKSRELVEMVCKELATKVAEQKEELEELRRDSLELEGGIEEERRMMQLAEVWREEQVQMKLNDAKFELESQYNQMLDMISQLDSLLMSGSTAASSIDAIEPTRHDEIKEVTNGMKSDASNDVEFVNEPHGSRDLYTILEEIRGFKGNDRVDEKCDDRIGSPGSEVGSTHSENHQGSNCSFEQTERYVNMLMSSGDQVVRTIQEVPSERSAGRVDREQGCVGEWSLNELLNPHITRGMKGRVEWPRGFRKCGSSKAKGSQARMERQRAKLRSVVKHRARGELS